MSTQREDKPTWAAVPVAVRAQAEQIVGARVSRAVRAFGGYGPSATFVLTLEDGRRAFFKGVYPLPEGSAVRWALDEEELVYRELARQIHPWAPAFYGSFRLDDWHALLIEAVPGQRVPPWTVPLARAAARSFAEFHAGTMGTQLPDWLSRTQHLEFAGFWAAIADDPGARARLAALCPTPALRRTASAWITNNAPALVAAEEPLRASSGGALLHFDTRSDNIRIEGELLRIFDWPWACVGPPEFDLGAFAQSVSGEGGPDPEQLTAWYAQVHPLDDGLLTASVAALSGFFADRGSKPDLPELPRLRSFQRRQFKTTLGWAARRLSLAPPVWLQAVASD